jgi:hypothetical protein
MIAITTSNSMSVKPRERKALDIREHLQTKKSSQESGSSCWRIRAVAWQKRDEWMMYPSMTGSPSGTMRICVILLSFSPSQRMRPLRTFAKIFGPQARFAAPGL